MSEYGQNASVFYAQSKEEREAKTKKAYIGNGKVVWTDGIIKTARDLAPAETETLDSNLEF